MLDMSKTTDDQPAAPATELAPARAEARYRSAKRPRRTDNADGAGRQYERRNSTRANKRRRRTLAVNAILTRGQRT